MKSNIKSTYQLRAKLLKALSHPTRLFIIDELAKGARCVCELTDMIGADISTVSKHLSLLKASGIIESERNGTQIYYTLKLKCIPNFFMCIEAMLRENLEEQLKLMK